MVTESQLNLIRNDPGMSLDLMIINPSEIAHIYRVHQNVIVTIRVHDFYLESNEKIGNDGLLSILNQLPTNRNMLWYEPFTLFRNYLFSILTTNK